MTNDFNVVNSFGRDDLARVYVVDFGDGRRVECVESLQPPHTREQKWVLLVSTSCGCPVKCRMCDAGMDFHGHLSSQQILAQMDFLVSRRYADQRVPADKFKVQFARMGEPAYNEAVLDVLEILPQRYHAPGLMGCVSTIAPRKCERFLERIIEIKDRLYTAGRFQLQFSIHSTDEKERDELMPVPKFTLEDIREYGDCYFKEGDRKITLNFALARGSVFDVKRLIDVFAPERFMFKITPLNPTYNVQRNKLTSYIDADDPHKRYGALDELQQNGFDVLVSIGENEENLIGSNCGQYVLRHLNETEKLNNSYLYVK
ncbi:radical SAM protein [candidate division WOR-3 bacterium]|nr:radical SAM protein [candidate division WOR-3 bacterium]